MVLREGLATNIYTHKIRDVHYLSNLQLVKLGPGPDLALDADVIQAVTASLLKNPFSMLCHDSSKAYLHRTTSFGY